MKNSHDHARDPLARHLIGINQTAQEIEISCTTKPPEIIYLQPRSQGSEVMSFAEFRKKVSVVTGLIYQ